MRHKSVKLCLLLGGIFASGLAFAAGEEGSGATSGLIAIASGLAVGLAVLGGTTAQGRAADAAVSGIARNPTSSDKVFMPLIISLALIEFQAIMGFIIAILWYNK